MNSKEAAAIVQQIQYNDGDPEVQHGLEDKLLGGLVDAVKDDRVFDALMIAEAALKVRAMDFERYYS